MQSIPQVIQKREEKLAHTKGIAKGEIWLDLLSLYGLDRQIQKLEEGTEELFKLAEEHQDLELKMEALLFFAKIYYTKTEFSKTNTYFNQIKSLNEKENNRKIWLQYYLLKTDIAQKQEQFEVAHAHLQEALTRISPKDILMQIKINQLLGIQHTMNNNLEQAFSYFFKALEWAENAENKNFKHYTQIVTLYLNITALYSRKLESIENNHSLSYYLNKALKIALVIQYKPAIINLQLQFADIETKSENYDKALSYFQSALKTAKTFQNQYVVTYCNDSIAMMYQMKGEFNKAIDMFQSNLDSALKMNRKALIISSLTNLSKCFSAQQNYPSALKHAQEALSVAEELNIEVSCLSLYKLMASLHKELGNIDTAFHFIQKHIDLKDEMYTAEKEKSIVEMQTRYETEKKEQEAEQLRILEQVKSRFFSQITHEFRTPLTLILGPVQQLLQHPKIQLDTELQNRLTLVERNGERLSNLVNQLLDLSKLESGKMIIQKKHGNVIAFVEAIVANFQTLAQQQNIHLYFEASVLELAANFDVDKLEKILYNLLSNAFKFTPSNGEITLKLQALQSEKGNHTKLQIILQDTGKGIAAAQLPHIFDRFYQADNSNVREVEGSGVGLSLVKELIELQGGTIEVKSEINVGTTFTFHLPLELSDLHQTEFIAEKTPVQNFSFKTFHTTLKDASSNKKKTKSTTKNKDKNIVLVVEDNPDMQTYIQSILSPQYEVLQAMNGEEGVNMALEEIPDLIVSDVMMPKKDGYTLCKELKINDKTNHIPIFLLTAKAAFDSRIEGLQQGADVYLSKPFSPKELLLNIENQIKVRQQLQEKYSQFLLSSDQEKAQEPITNPFLQKLIDTIEKHLNDIELSVKQLSEYMFMSRQQIHRKLRALTNYSTSEFIRLIRLQKAKELLQSQQYTMTEIAYEVGFSTPSYFSRAFAKQFGVSPSKWVGEKV